MIDFGVGAGAGRIVNGMEFRDRGVGIGQQGSDSIGLVAGCIRNIPK